MISSIANLPENVSLIPLSQNARAIVDPEDVELLEEYRWQLMAKNQLRYARRNEGKKTIYMHREIMNAPEGMQIDHINGNGLDNRKVNLRLCNNSQNQQNARKKRVVLHILKVLTSMENNGEQESVSTVNKGI